MDMNIHKQKLEEVLEADRVWGRLLGVRNSETNEHIWDQYYRVWLIRNYGHILIEAVEDCVVKYIGGPYLNSGTYDSDLSNLEYFINNELGVNGVKCNPTENGVSILYNSAYIAEFCLPHKMPVGMCEWNHLEDWKL